MATVRRVRAKNGGPFTGPGTNTWLLGDPPAGIVIDPAQLEGQLQLALRLFVDLPWLAGPLGERARARVLERFSLAANIDTLVDLYREVASG